MNKVVIVNGVAQSGKNTFTEYYDMYSNYPVFDWSTVDNVKELAKQMGWDGVKDDKSRKFLSDLKDLWTEYNDGIFKCLVNSVERVFIREKNPVIFIHCREPKEIDKFKKYFGNKCTTLLVKRCGIETPGNHADKNVNNYKYDVILTNNGSLEDLKNKVIKIVEEYENKIRAIL